jgi:HlyD family secretion protein
MNRLRQWWSTASHTKKVVTGIIGIVIIGIIILIASKKSSTGNQATTVTKGNVVNNVVLSGSTDSASAVSLGFASQGRVRSVTVKEGDKVFAGEVIASLDTAGLQASLKSAKAALTIAEANNTNTSTNIATVTAQQNTLVQNAYNTLLSNHLEANPVNLSVTTPAPSISGTYTGPQGQYSIHVFPSGSASGSSFTVSGLENSFAQPAATTTSVPLGTHGLFIQFQSNTVYGAADWTVSIPNTSSSTYTADKNAYDAAVAARTQAITTAENAIANSNNAGSVAAAQIQQAQAQVDSVIAQIQQAEIIAPFNGVVSQVNVKPGQTTNSFNPSSSSSGDLANASISLLSENDYEVTLKTPEIDVASIAVGQLVSLTLDAFGTESFAGTITSINPAETIVDGVPVYQTKVSFTKLDPRIRSGMTTTATINVGEKDNVLAVPASFIHTDTSGSYVYILNDKHTTKQLVTVGLRGSDSMVEITSGLSAGQTIDTDAQ